jgi:hypothetical protein
VPTEIAESPSRAMRAAERMKPAAVKGTDERAVARAAIDALTEQLAIANRRLDEAAGLRAELDARRQWGLRRRLRWALSRRR